MDSRPRKGGDDPDERKSRMAKLWEDCKAGRKQIDMIEEDPKVACFERQMKYMKFALDEQYSDRQDTPFSVWVFWGPTDLGKTYTAINRFCNRVNYYIVDAPISKGQKLWFDGYSGERNLILDDFSDVFCGLEYLKRLLDKYKLKVEIKGGYVWAAWVRVFITSNYPPNQWYKTWDGHIRDDLEPLRRRITNIYHFIDRDTWQKQDFEGNNIEDAKPIVAELLDSPLPARNVYNYINVAAQQVSPLPFTPDTSDDGVGVGVGIPAPPSWVPQVRHEYGPLPTETPKVIEPPKVIETPKEKETPKKVETPRVQEILESDEEEEAESQITLHSQYQDHLQSEMDKATNPDEEMWAQFYLD